MNTETKLQLDYPAWRLSFDEYADIGGNVILDRVQANQDWFDNWPSEDQLSVMEQSYDQFQIDGGEGDYDARDDGRSDGYGESYAERNA